MAEPSLFVVLVSDATAFIEQVAAGLCAGSIQTVYRVPAEDIGVALRTSTAQEWVRREVERFGEARVDRITTM